MRRAFLLAKNSKGSTLILLLVIVATLGVAITALVSLSSQLAQAEKQKSIRENADSIGSSISALVSRTQTCLNGLGTQAGLQFYNQMGILSTFNPQLAATVNGQNISLPSLYRYPTGVSATRYMANTVLDEVNMVIRRLYLKEPVALGGYSYAVTVFADIQPTNSTGLQLAPKEIAELKLTIHPSTGELTDCERSMASSPNYLLCEGMGCVYTLSPTGQGNCYCPIQPVSCPNGRYISSVINNSPQCSADTVTRTCSAIPDGFLVALDANSNAVCGVVSRCPAGSSRVGAGVSTSIPECKCANATDTWDGTACSAPAGCTWSSEQILTSENVPQDCTNYAAVQQYCLPTELPGTPGPGAHPGSECVTQITPLGANMCQVWGYVCGAAPTPTPSPTPATMVVNCGATQITVPADTCYTVCLPTSWQDNSGAPKTCWANGSGGQPARPGQPVVIGNDNGCSQSPTFTDGTMVPTPIGGGCYGQMTVSCDINNNPVFDYICE